MQFYFYYDNITTMEIYERILMLSFIKNLFFKNDPDNKQPASIKWPANLNPINIYIAPIELPDYAEHENTYRNMVIKAFNVWSVASGEKIKFEVTDSLYDSSINVKWLEGNGENFGHCTYNYDQKGRLYSATIFIDLITKKIDRIDYNTEIYHGILHCVGAALGLPTTDNPDDIMCSPHQFGKIELSKNDKNAIYNLYN